MRLQCVIGEFLHIPNYIAQRPELLCRLYLLEVVIDPATESYKATEKKSDKHRKQVQNEVEDNLLLSS